MTVRQDVFRALHDAIDWQATLADANRADAVERKKCLALIARYRAILKKWYGTDRTTFDELIAQCELVSVSKLRQPKRRGRNY